MSYVKTIREAINENLDKMQAKAEAAELQASLGQMELETRFGDQYRSMSEAATQLHEKLIEAGFPEEKIKQEAQEALDNLQLKLALGKMESRDAVDEVKQQVEQRISDFDKALDGIDLEQYEGKVKKIAPAIRSYAEKVAGMKAALDARADVL